MRFAYYKWKDKVYEKVKDKNMRKFTHYVTETLTNFILTYVSDIKYL